MPPRSTASRKLWIPCEYKRRPPKGTPRSPPTAGSKITSNRPGKAHRYVLRIRQPDRGPQPTPPDDPGYSGEGVASDLRSTARPGARR
eukprot:2084979-Pyramimonas_sp.AAC.1